MRFYRAEAIAAAIITVITLAALALAQVRGVTIDYASFAGRYSLAGLMIGLAMIYRRAGRKPTIPLTLLSCAIFILFSNAGAVLNFLLLRPGMTPIDSMLFRIDAALGFDWRSLAEQVVRYPAFNAVLQQVYLSSMVQLALVIIVLGFSGQRTELHRLLLVGMIASCLSMAIWTIAPSFGPSPYIMFDPITEARLGRVVDAEYGARMLELLTNAPTRIDEASLIGVIGFPSMHTVMAAMAIYFARRRQLLFWPLAALNLLMVPAILVQGSHHLIDVIGGGMVFVAVLWSVRKIVPDEEAALAPMVRPPAGRRIAIASLLTQFLGARTPRQS